MDLKEKDNENNVIRLDNQRHRKKTNQTKWRIDPKATTRSKLKSTGKGGAKVTWIHYVQFFLFIAFLAYALQQCR